MRLSLEQVLVILFAGGPGFAALVIQWWKHRTEAPMREANLAQTLTSTASSLLDRMQLEIDSLKDELRLAEDQIIKLEARLDASQEFALEAAREREKRSLLEIEVARLRGHASGMFDEREEHDKNPTEVEIVGQTEAIDVDVIDKTKE